MKWQVPSTREQSLSKYCSDTYLKNLRKLNRQSICNPDTSASQIAQVRYHYTNLRSYISLTIMAMYQELNAR
jgi:hypothetical protein